MAEQPLAIQIADPPPERHHDTASMSAAGTAPAGVSSRFRPDIEGMRAIAVLLVVLYHAYGTPFVGGFVGVDVFFVISGFLITGLLLRERERSGRISVSDFYARRVRRILPAATLVVLVTLFATYRWLGFIAGNSVAGDAKWSAVFAANLHFGLTRTDYFGAQMPPSPLQHMWSLGVEEQFYLIWPGVTVALLLVARRMHHRKVLAGALCAIIAASLTWSVLQTSVNQTWAYFSPLTRAWELALGALIAVMAPTIARRLKYGFAPSALAFVGLAGIVLAAVLLTSQTRYPGAAVALPVLGSGALIAAGCADPRTLVGRCLSIHPMRWLGARSYSLYLWHWPLLVIPDQYSADDMSVLATTGWVLLAVVASEITYRLVENPFRRAKLLTARTGTTLALGLALVGITILTAQWCIASHFGSWDVLR
ncbi:acyltransferase [Mycobacterium sp. 141]|uniref:acyltransferase family protein n=1 Tax=Mycobacterium sp. 141 TaxID=1120797 RepID=UPI000371642B|nr:acyltransferase [Mycobacterium sp. 141]